MGPSTLSIQYRKDPVIIPDGRIGIPKVDNQGLLQVGAHGAWTSDCFWAVIDSLENAVDYSAPVIFKRGDNTALEVPASGQGFSYYISSVSIFVRTVSVSLSRRWFSIVDASSGYKILYRGSLVIPTGTNDMNNYVVDNFPIAIPVGNNKAIYFVMEDSLTLALYVQVRGYKAPYVAPVW